MLFALQQISHHFGSLHVLDDVSFDVQPGDVHALVGENGAGKTTLMRVAYGMLRPEQGAVVVDGHTIPGGFASPMAARRAAVGMVHQHFTSIPAFSVAENLALAGGWNEHGAKAEARATTLIAGIGLPVDPAARVDTLSVAMRQRLEILKALAADVRVLLLDEPTAVLAPREVLELQEAVRAFAGRGGAVVLITHKLPEVFAMSNRVTVLRRGQVVLTGRTADENGESLARAMLGDHPATVRSPLPRRDARDDGEVLVRASGLDLRQNASAGVTVRDASFVCRAGEITGFVAIEGNGQRELLRAIAGVDATERTAGTLDVTGPVAFIPDDRLREALIPDFTIAENVLLGTLGDERWIDWPRVRRDTAQLLERFDVRAQGPDEAVRNLSGGNQQKVVFGRALMKAPRVLVAEQPTRGLDLRATAAIHRQLREAADAGMAVLVHAADLDEVIAIADQLLVVAAGTVISMPADATREQIGDAMLGRGAVAGAS